jgi:hypothetical protein
VRTLALALNSAPYSPVASQVSFETIIDTARAKQVNSGGAIDKALPIAENRDIVPRGNKPMPSEAIRNNLGDWQNPPLVQDKVIAYMESIGAPMLLREIYYPLGLSKVAVNRVLGRLHAKGVLTRYKIPVLRHRPDRWTKSILPSAATRLCFLYSFADKAEDG